MAKKEVKKVKVYVKENTFIMVNGKKEEIKKGVQEMEVGKAQILIDAKVAELVKEKEDKEDK